MFSVCNVALNRPSYQSSLYIANGFWAPHMGNDGKTNLANTATQSICAHSKPETNPWWTVDLGMPLSVEEVFFTNRVTGG